jgi:hypothetical protein
VHRYMTAFVAGMVFLLASIAGAASLPPPPEVTIDAVTQHSVTLGSLSCDSRYRLRVQIYVGDVLSGTTELETTTQACPEPPPPPPEPPPPPPPPPGVGDALPPLLGPSLGASLYVATDGTDHSNNCLLISRPCQTIGQAEQHVHPGDTVYVRGGTYTGNLVISTHGTFTAPITFRNYPNERVVLHSAVNDAEMIKVDCSARFLRIQGFVIEATPNLWIGTGHQALWVQGSSCGATDIEIRRNFFEGFDQGTTHRHDLTPTLAGPASERVHYIGNVVRHWGPGEDQRQGIYFQGQDGLIANNVVYDGLHGFGIQVRGDSAARFCNNVIVTGNTVVDWPKESTGGGRGIIVEDTCRGVRVRNNISAFEVGSQEEMYGIDGPALDPPASSNRAFTNLLWDDDSTNRCGNTNNHEILDFTDGDGIYADCGDNIEADPQFVDRADGDFHLQAGSPAIDAADPHWALPFDFNGLPRVGTPDIGAYETQ